MKRLAPSHFALLAVAAALPPLADAGAQHLSAGQFSVHGRSAGFPSSQTKPRPERDSSRIALMVLSGGGLGAVGLVSGILIADARGGDLEEIGVAALIGESLLLPMGVYLANNRRGNYVLSALASGIIGTLAFVAADKSDTPYPLFAMPFAQLYAAISIERRTAR